MLSNSIKPQRPVKVDYSTPSAFFEIRKLEEIESELDGLDSVEQIYDFFNRYFHTDEQKRCINFFAALEVQSSVKEMLRCFKDIMFFSLIVGFPTLDYFLIEFERILESKPNSMSLDTFLDGFLKCMYFYMADKALRNIVFREFIRINDLDSTNQADLALIKGDTLPRIYEFGEKQNVISGDFSNADLFSLYEKATSLNDFLSMFEAPSRKTYGLVLLCVNFDKTLLTRLYKICEYREKIGDKSFKLDYDFYYSNNISLNF